MHTFLNLLDHFINLWEDRKRGINTTGFIPVYEISTNSQNISDSKPYQATNYRLLKIIFRNLDLKSENYNFIDIGSGLGRVLHFAKDFNFKKLIGVEFGENLYSKALENLKGTNIELFCEDILDFNPPDSPNIYFLYNPFNGNILRSFLEKVSDNDIFIYVNPLRGFVFDMRGYEHKILHHSSNHNRIVHLYYK